MVLLANWEARSAIGPMKHQNKAAQQAMRESVLRWKSQTFAMVRLIGPVQHQTQHALQVVDYANQFAPHRYDIRYSS